MKQLSIYRMTNMIILISIIGSLICYPFRASFIGGLLFALFSAATIGGLADTFAVTALFKDPLNIPWPRWMGTRIIERNRERLIDEVVKMVEDDLLSIEAIREKLELIHFEDSIFDYILKHDGDEDMAVMLSRLIKELLQHTDPAEIARYLEDWIVEQTSDAQASDQLARILEWSLAKGYVDRVIDFALDEGRYWVNSYYVRSVLTGIVTRLIDRYRGDKLVRKLVLDSKNFEPYKISSEALEKVTELMTDMQQKTNPNRRKINNFLSFLVLRLKYDEELRDKVEKGKNNLLQSDNIRKVIENILKSQTDKVKNISDEKLTSQLQSMIRRLVEKASTSQHFKNRFYQFLNKNIMKMIEKQHHLIGKMVRKELDHYDTKRLITLVEEKAGKDLQFIRINGTVVGALVGIVLHLATFWVD